MASQSLSCFTVSRSWLVDTGCASDLICRRSVEEFKNKTEECRPHYFNTANGHSQSNSLIQLKVPPLSDDAAAIVMDQTPAVLSVGARQKQGYSFLWMTGCSPCWVRPDRTVVVLDVYNDIPYLSYKGAHSSSYDDKKLSKLLGLPISQGKLLPLTGQDASAAEDDSPGPPSKEELRTSFRRRLTETRESRFQKPRNR